MLEKEKRLLWIWLRQLALEERCTLKTGKLITIHCALFSLRLHIGRILSSAMFFALKRPKSLERLPQSTLRNTGLNVLPLKYKH